MDPKFQDLESRLESGREGKWEGGEQIVGDLSVNNNLSCPKGGAQTPELPINR